MFELTRRRRRAASSGASARARRKTFSVATPLRRCRRATDGEDLYEHESGDEAADVRRVCDASLLRAAAEQPDAADELEQEPKAERDVCGHGRQEAEEDDVHAVAREEKYVAAEHARNRARRAEARHEKARRVAAEGRGHEDVSERRKHAAHEVEDEIPQVSDAVFHVVAENPEEEHVAEYVRPAAVHEHRN